MFCVQMSLFSADSQLWCRAVHGSTMMKSHLILHHFLNFGPPEQKGRLIVCEHSVGLRHPLLWCFKQRVLSSSIIIDRAV
jgi:hypothetical protein